MQQSENQWSIVLPLAACGVQTSVCRSLKLDRARPRPGSGQAVVAVCSSRSQLKPWHFFRSPASDCVAQAFAGRTCPTSSANSRPGGWPRQAQIASPDESCRRVVWNLQSLVTSPLTRSLSIASTCNLQHPPTRTAHS